MAYDPTFQNNPKNAGILAEARELMAANPPHMFKAFYRQLLWATLDEFERAKHVVQGRVIVIHGQTDKVIPIAAAEPLKEVLVAPGDWHVIANTSHQVMQERPDEVFELIKVFVDKHKTDEVSTTTSPATAI